MIKRLEAAMARVEVVWLSAERGGRTTGPPTAPVYAATCVFSLAGDAMSHPGWPQDGDALSILLEAEGVEDGSRMYKVDFLARDLARPFLQVDAMILIMEGPRVVGEGRVIDVDMASNHADPNP